MINKEDEGRRVDQSRVAADGAVCVGNCKREDELSYYSCVVAGYRPEMESGRVVIDRSSDRVRAARWAPRLRDWQLFVLLADRASLVFQRFASGFLLVQMYL